MPAIARTLLVVVAAGLLAVQVVRIAAVTDEGSRATVAKRLWPSHPAVLVDRAMGEIGTRAAHGEGLTPAILAEVDQLAIKAPLAPEPFLIKGALAQVEQRQQHAERLFAAARARDPRSVAARYFLADRYLRSGRTSQALAEIAALAQLFPQGMAGFGPALASFAHTPGAVPQLRALFRTSPDLEPVVLGALADDASNARLALNLWGRRTPVPAGTAEWQAKLISKLVEHGQFTGAYEVWRLVTGVQDGQGSLFNPGFAKSPAPPPFNWKYATTGGVIEPAGRGRLQIIYFGRGDAVLAEQLLLLTAGRYRLSMDISDPPGAGGEIGWTLTCLPGGQALVRLPIERKGPVAVTFAVPPGCAAQRLSLSGIAGDFPQSQDFSIGAFSLTKAPGA